MIKKEKFKYDKSFEEIFNRINSDSGLIFVDTPEETKLIREIYRKFKNHYVHFWSIGQGLHKIVSKTDPDKFLPNSPLYTTTKAIKNKSGELKSEVSVLACFGIIQEDCYKKIEDKDLDFKNIYILRDADKFLNQPLPIRILRDLIYLASCSSVSIIISGFGVTVPNDISKDSVYVKLNYPSKEDIINKMIPKLREKIKDHNETCEDEDKVNSNFDDHSIAQACVGLTEDQILNTLQYTTSIDNDVNINRILEEKKAIINKSDILDYWLCNNDLSEVGGFEEIKKWLKIRKTIMTNVEAAKEFKASYPKGMLLLGTQGSGKTLIGKAVAQFFNTGLIKFDMSKVFAGVVGESEKRMRQALSQVEAAGGVVLIDEIDKGISGAGSSDRSDGGTTSRVIGTFLTWLNEEHPGVFIICTANDISNIMRNHPELLRKGRFDEIWFSDTPNYEERKEIYKIHLKKNGRNPENFDIDALASLAYEDKKDGKLYNLTGAEIEYAIKDAIQEKFAEGNGESIKIGSDRDITTEDILKKAKLIIPMEKQAKDTIKAMRDWSRDNARSVSSQITEVITEKTPKKSKMSLRSVASKCEI